MVWVTHVNCDKRRQREQAKDADRLDPEKGCGWMFGLPLSQHADNKATGG